MNPEKRTPVSFVDVMRSISDRILGRVCSSINKGRNDMNTVLRRDITGECFDECRNTVREAEVRRQAKINKIVREAETNRQKAGSSAGMASRDFSSEVSRAY